MEEIFSVKNKVALITGASSGIGRHFAKTLAKYGAHVILIGRNQERLIAAEQDCQKYDVNTFSICADIQKEQEVAGIVEKSKKLFSQVDILINSAGIAKRVPLLEVDGQQWDDTININLKGTFLVSQAIAKWMIATKTAGRIINISSAAVFNIIPTLAEYSASKIGVESLTRTFAMDLVSHKICVNCIAPGFFVTDINRDYLQTDSGKSDIDGIPMRRAADVRELEGILLLLASNASSYMTGSIVRVDGGYSINKV